MADIDATLDLMLNKLLDIQQALDAVEKRVRHACSELDLLMETAADIEATAKEILNILKTED